MPIKVTQLTSLTTIDGTVIVPVVDVAGSPISKRTTVANIATHILTGNAATATNLAPSTTTLASNVVSSSLTSVGTLTNLTVTNPISGSLAGNASSATKLANARNINGIAFDGTEDITITTSVPNATTETLGLVKIGAGINIAVDGTISAPTKLFHGFSVDADGNLIYSTTDDTSINLQDEYGADIYEDTDIGTNEYAYSLDSDGNLIVTFS